MGVKVNFELIIWIFEEGALIKEVDDWKMQVMISILPDPWGSVRKIDLKFWRQYRKSIFTKPIKLLIVESGTVESGAVKFEESYLIANSLP